MLRDYTVKTFMTFAGSQFTFVSHRLFRIFSFSSEASDTHATEIRYIAYCFSYVSDELFRRYFEIINLSLSSASR